MIKKKGVLQPPFNTGMIIMNEYNKIIEKSKKEAVKIIRQSGQDNIIVAGDLEI